MPFESANDALSIRLSPLTTFFTKKRFFSYQIFSTLFSVLSAFTYYAYIYLLAKEHSLFFLHIPSSQENPYFLFRQMMACSTSFTGLTCQCLVVVVGPFLRSCAGPRPFLSASRLMFFFAAGSLLIII